LRLTAAVALMVGAWVLISELPRAISAGDENWWKGLQVTVYYSVGTVPFQLGISLVLATLLFRNIVGQGFFRMIYFLPYITPPVAAAAIFRVLFSSRPSAPINNLIGLLGAESLLWLDEPAGIVQMIAGPNVTLPGWAAGPSLALTVIIMYNIWTYVGYDTVIFLAGLGSIPGELYEAAAIDGAGRAAQFRHITFPLLSPTTYFLTLMAVIGTFKAFNHVWVLRSTAALGTTDTASVAIFQEFFRNTRYGYASSLAIVLLGVVMILTLINNRIARERVFYG
jgi:multiple sugar transport system permease protein